MRTTIFPLFNLLFLLLVSSELVSQYTEAECPTEVGCQTDYTGWTGDLNGDLPLVEIFLSTCDDFDPFNVHSIKFEAVSHEFSASVSYDICPEWGAGLGIKEGCEASDLCVEYDACEFFSFAWSISTSELVVGREYLFYISSCPVCEYTITITHGPEESFESLNGIEVNRKEPCSLEYEEDRFCLNEELELKVTGPDENIVEYFNNKDASWRGIIDGPVSFGFDLESLDDFPFEELVPGDYILTLESVEFICKEYDLGFVSEFSVFDITEEYGSYLVCESELSEGNWAPEDWKGEIIEEAGSYESVYYNECNCIIRQYVEVEEYKELISEAYLELCPDDYPYEFFDGYDLDYFSYDYDILLVFRGESLVESTEGTDCDSLIHLYVYNENPEDRCSSCQLPLSLEKSKIVYCIPFDNGSFDVSGNANRVIANGVGYDNNGPASNPLWEAVLDGKDDHVRLPHINDLNTSSFAIDLHFNKDDRFNSEGIETLLIKGDGSKDNERIKVELHEKSDDTFDLKAFFYTESEVHEFTIADLERKKWYGTSYVVEDDSIGVYLNGELYAQQLKTAGLKGNSEDFYLGTRNTGGQLELSYGGRLDNFKYWKQKLSGQDILFLYYPEKEFEQDIDFYLSCCESVEYKGYTINNSNTIDSIVVPGASPTGYDSVYILRYQELELEPQVNTAYVPDDQIINQLISCGMSCEKDVSWSVDEAQLFSDLCGVEEIIASHTSPVRLDENISYVEVVYTGRNACGYESQVSFALELNCEYEDYTPLPESAELNVVSEMCNELDLQYCKGQEIQLALTKTMGEEIPPYDYEDLMLNYSLNGIALQRAVTSPEDLMFDFSESDAGVYELCVENLESRCDAKEINKCKTIEIVGFIEKEYSLIESCIESIRTLVPDEMSEGLKELLTNSITDGIYEASYMNSCGCEVREVVEIDYKNTATGELELTICEDDFPINILGREIDGSEEYDSRPVQFESQSMWSDGNGVRCDSIVYLTIHKYPSEETELYVQICEGEDYNGYSEAGVYEEDYTTDNSCDSTVYVNLEVLPKRSQTVTASICEGEDYNGYTEAGQYEIVSQAVNGCDSITVLTLEILGLGGVQIFEEICEGDTFRGYSESGVYEELYVAANGCDSIVIVNLTVLYESHPDCLSSSVYEQKLDIRIFPNPTRDILIINHVSDKLTNKIDELSLYSLDGKRVYYSQGLDKTLDMTSMKSGLYIIKIRVGERYFIEQIMKL